ncbi:glycoside hydrolase family 130 protein [Serratia fonticola]|uniref:glycoside hydrolase family 130 protein n=1 Tax=Serratia fonticola TaxID=47917 RepID=UPI002096E072|nr:glycoside hydrolase family 130 protein [Serratia fonticola]MCO7512771.1 glycoside hydrolase family 130 protein [Serratia fonticola]
MIRFSGNPLITPQDITPSRPGFKVECAFNAGVTRLGDETIMLVRIAESVIPKNEGTTVVPWLQETPAGWQVTTREFWHNDLAYDFSDPRLITYKADPAIVYLTSLSHLRVARSGNDVDFVVDTQPLIFPANGYETFGCEDARITEIEGAFYINYSAVSSKGICTALAVTKDFTTVERLGLIFCPDNRDVCLFPEKVGGKYMALHRPAPKHFGKPEIWLASSNDLLHWGQHQHLLGTSQDPWDALKLGGGAPMLKTTKGWLQIYHGVDVDQRYALGAMLLDLDDPTRILAKSPVPLLQPQAPYELYGFFDNVVFTCGALIENDTLRVYYGAADESMCLAEMPLAQLWQHLSV